MKKVMSLIFVVLFFCLSNCAQAGHPVESAGPVEESEVGIAPPAPLEPGGGAPKGSEAGKEHTAPLEPAGPEKESEVGKAPSSPLEPTGSKPLPGPPGEGGPSPWGEIFFASGTVSPDGKYLYVILDRFLFKYALPTLDLRRKVELDIAVAPVNPSISISEDGKYIYVIYNGIVYQIDAVEFRIEKRVKITP